MKIKLFPYQAGMYLLFTLCSFGLHAQSSPASFISINGGAAIPMGHFASSESGDAASGFAGTGTHFSLEGAYFISGHFGIGGALSTSSFQTDVTGLANRYLEDYDCDSASAKAGPYHTFSVMVGPYYSLPIHRFTIDIRVLGGITNTWSPDFIGTVINERNGPGEGSISTFVQTSSTANAFGFQGGVGIRYNIGQHLQLSLRGDYFYSKPELQLDNINRANALGVILDKYNQPVSGINATLGVGYRL